jgi:AcrR family transcriptional regulator
MTAKRSGAKGKSPPRHARPKAGKVSRAKPEDESALSRARIAEAAIALLDEAGVEGLTMRRLADRLGSGVMSLYWHVDKKEDVFDLALDAVLAYRGPPDKSQPAAKPPETGKSPDWRTEVVHLLEDWRASMLRHPWSAALLPRRVLGPNILGRLEQLSQILSEAGVGVGDVNVAIWSLWNHVMGATITRASFDVSDEDRAAAQAQLAQLSGRYPIIERTRLLLDDDWDGAFRRGIGFLLDGLARRGA